MHFFTKHITVALSLISQYDGSVPLTIYLKKHFAQHKKYGSKDRKQIAHICYCYCRLGFALSGLDAAERAMIAVYLCTAEQGAWLQAYNEEWQRAYTSDFGERLSFVQTKHSFSAQDIFRFTAWLSSDIDARLFCLSHLQQPCLFIRIRPNEQEAVMAKLMHQNIPFEVTGNNAVALRNTTDAEAVFALNKEVVIQDLSSQQVASFFGLMRLPAAPEVWDCCAASGGKSILAYDYLPKARLAVSDIRSSIIHNLRQRFWQAGITSYQAFVADVSASTFLVKQTYDVVICDAPCSGSGTWSRTPEQLLYFTEHKLLHYTQLQQAIATNALKAVKKGGYFLYITCSVFRQENEEMVAQLLQQPMLKLIEGGAIKGYGNKADTMYAALLQKE